MHTTNNPSPPTIAISNEGNSQKTKEAKLQQKRKNKMEAKAAAATAELLEEEGKKRVQN